MHNTYFAAIGPEREAVEGNSRSYFDKRLVPYLLSTNGKALAGAG